MTWLVSANDTYFSPELSRQLADAFRAGGGKVDFRVIAGVWRRGPLAGGDRGGIKVAAPELERALKAAPSDRGEKAMTGAPVNPWPDDDVILYDGVCVFCSRWVRFVAARDVARRFRFTAIQSPTARGWRRRSASTPTIPTPTPSSMAASRISNPTPR